MPANNDQMAAEAAATAEQQRYDEMANHPPRQSETSNAKIRQHVNRGGSSFSSNGGQRNQHHDHDDDDNAQNYRMQNYHNLASANNMNANNSSTKQPTPLFERLVTEEVQEIKAYARIIDGQQRRLLDLERIHGDLETRLEEETNRRQQLETTLEAREREWANRFEELSKDRDHWKGVVQVEQTKNARLIDQVVRKDQDIHRMLQRKVRMEDANACLPVESFSQDDLVFVCWYFSSPYPHIHCPSAV